MGAVASASGREHERTPATVPGARLVSARVVLGVIGAWALLGALVQVLPWIPVVLAAVALAVVVAVTQWVLHRRRTRARERQLARLEAQLARAHRQALDARIRPHLLFDSLQAVGRLWRGGHGDDADAVLDHLGSLFHEVQRVTSQSEVPLADELAVVREYLALERARLRDRLRPRITATPEAEACLVPPLLLQPIVENAVRHGVVAASSAGVVELRAEVRDGWLRVTVRDDGPGFDHAPPSPGNGSGLRDTRERLAQRYGAGASLDLAEAPGGGALVLLSLPASTGPRNDAEGRGNSSHGKLLSPGPAMRS